MIFVHRPGYYNPDHLGTEECRQTHRQKAAQRAYGSQDLIFVPHFVRYSPPPTVRPERPPQAPLRWNEAQHG